MEMGGLRHCPPQHPYPRSLVCSFEGVAECFQVGPDGGGHAEPLGPGLSAGLIG